MVAQAVRIQGTELAVIQRLAKAGSKAHAARAVSVPGACIVSIAIITQISDAVANVAYAVSVCAAGIANQQLATCSLRVAEAAEALIIRCARIAVWI